jgi:putative lipoic acid-binding regulatory protein
LTEDEQRSLDLLNANHTFPGEYPLSVIALHNDQVTAAIHGAIADELGTPLGDVERRSSSGGKYLSHRLSVRCAQAADVLRLYARLRRIDGVMTVI